MQRPKFLNYRAALTLLAPMNNNNNRHDSPNTSIEVDSNNKNKHIPKKFKARLSVRLSLLSLTLGIPVILLVCPTVYGILFEFIEHSIIKGYFVHKLLNDAAKSTVLVKKRRPPASTVNNHDEVILWQHLPRTSADTIRTHLIHKSCLGFESSHPYPIEYEKHEWMIPHFRRWMGKVMGRNNMEKEEGNGGVEGRGAVEYAKGFVSRRDFAIFDASLTNGTMLETDGHSPILRRIIFLRHPIERILSVGNMVKPKVQSTTNNKTWHPISLASLLSTYSPLVNSHDGAVAQPLHPPFRDERQLSAIPQPEWVGSFLYNSMAWQLGDAMELSRRNTTISRDELLRRAKQTISSTEFVGFYETLPSDFLRLWLHTNLYEPEQRNRLMPVIFWLCSLAALPRLKTLSYSGMLEKDELEVLRRYNDIDLELWEWAVTKYRKNLVMYDSLPSFAVSLFIFLIRWIVLAIIFLYCVKLVRRRWDSGRSTNKAETISLKVLPLHTSVLSDGRL